MGLLTTLLTILLIQFIFAFFAIVYKTDKVTDLSYGLTFVVIALLSYFQNSDSSTVKLVVLILVAIWGIRLAGYLFSRIVRSGKDHRFDGIRENPLRFAGFWLLQAISIFIISLPYTMLFMKESLILQTISVIGIVVSALGILIESVADYQKTVFKNIETNKGKFIQSGLWKYSRHPNYLGEIMMWAGIFVITIPYLKGVEYISILSPLFIIFLLLFVTGVPTIEKRNAEKFKGNREYERYISNTGKILPKILLD